MSTIKSSSENLTLNADGVGSDVVIKNNGTETVRVDGSGTVTATSLNVDTIKNEAGTREYGRCIAWLNFNGTGTVVIRDSLNVSSITDDGRGDYTVSFAQSMANTNYCVTATAGNTSRSWATAYLAGTKTTLNFSLRSASPSNGATFDFEYFDVQIFGGDS